MRITPSCHASFVWMKKKANFLHYIDCYSVRMLCNMYVCLCCFFIINVFRL